MELVYNNPNRIGFRVSHTEADMYVDDVYLGRAISDTVIRVARKSDFYIPLRIKTDMRNIFKNAWSAISHRKLQCGQAAPLPPGLAVFTKPFRWLMRANMSWGCLSRGREKPIEEFQPVRKIADGFFQEARFCFVLPCFPGF